MLVWLASYPRSGNTLARMLIHRAFGLKTRTIVGFEGDKNFIGKEGVLEMVGASKDETSQQALIDEAKKCDEIYLIKTHDAPLTDDPTIYVIRDGRSSIVSYLHFIREIGKFDCEIEQVIRGEVYPGSWSDHLQAWNPDLRNNTLILRYEDLVINPSASLQCISAFLGISQTSNVSVDFDDMHRRFPEFFRVGNDSENINELNSSGYVELFDEYHSKAMRRYGYYPKSSTG